MARIININTGQEVEQELKMPDMKCHREVKGREFMIYSYKKLEARIQQEKPWTPSKRRYFSLGDVS